MTDKFDSVEVVRGIATFWESWTKELRHLNDAMLCEELQRRVDANLKERKLDGDYRATIKNPHKRQFRLELKRLKPTIPIRFEIEAKRDHDQDQRDEVKQALLKRIQSQTAGIKVRSMVRYEELIRTHLEQRDKNKPLDIHEYKALKEKFQLLQEQITTDDPVEAHTFQFLYRVYNGEEVFYLGVDAYTIAIMSQSKFLKVDPTIPLIHRAV